MKVINIELIEEINSEMDKTLNENNNNEKDIIDKYANVVLKQITRFNKKLNKHIYRDKNNTNKIIRKKWRKPLACLNLYYHALYDLGEAYYQIHYSQAQNESNTLFFCLNMNFVRCLQITGEINTLLHNGYPDGAHGRWRTLHEISTIMNFLGKHPNSVEPYFDHDVVTSYKSMLQYNKYREFKFQVRQLV